jgi:hypothetical protein
MIILSSRQTRAQPSCHPSLPFLPPPHTSLTSCLGNFPVIFDYSLSIFFSSVSWPGQITSTYEGEFFPLLHNFVFSIKLTFAFKKICSVTRLWSLVQSLVCGLWCNSPLRCPFVSGAVSVTLLDLEHPRDFKLTPLLPRLGDELSFWGPVCLLLFCILGLYPQCSWVKPFTKFLRQESPLLYNWRCCRQELETDS